MKSNPFILVSLLLLLVLPLSSSLPTTTTTTTTVATPNTTSKSSETPATTSAIPWIRVDGRCTRESEPSGWGPWHCKPKSFVCEQPGNVDDDDDVGGMCVDRRSPEQVEVEGQEAADWKDKRFSAGERTEMRLFTLVAFICMLVAIVYIYHLTVIAIHKTQRQERVTVVEVATGRDEWSEKEIELLDATGDKA